MMVKYSVSIPINIECESGYDNFSVITKQEVSISKQFNLKGMNCHVEYDEGVGKIVMNDVEAENGFQAYFVVKEWGNEIVKLLSLYYQRENCNQHLAHLRFKLSNEKVEIIPSDAYTMARLQSILKSYIKIDDLEYFIDRQKQSEELEFISNAYYGSLQSMDDKAKYYHAFTIIEFLENLHKKEVGTKRYLAQHCEDIGREVYGSLLKLGYSEEDLEIAKSSVISNLKKSTIDNRQEKLHYILTELYGIEKVRYMGEEIITIDIDVVKALISARNKLFHGGGNLDVKRLTDILILICEKVYWKFLND